MLISCRQSNDGFLDATAENARLLIELNLHRLPKPRFSMDIIQTVMAKRYNYETKAYDLWDFVSLYEGGIRSDPESKPEEGKFVLAYHKDTWHIVVDI